MMAETKKVTIYDVARASGVSRQTVSRVINNRSDVAPETRSRIENVIRDLNYRPSAVAQSLSRQKSYILGVVTAGLKYIGPSVTLNGITDQAEALGYGLLLKTVSDFVVHDVLSILQWFQSHQVDGIIWAIPEISDNRIWLDVHKPDLDLPIIFMAMEKHERVNIVCIDNANGARLATEHLIDMNCKHIGHISGPLDWLDARQRKHGWSKTLNEAGYSVSDQMCAEGNWSSKSGKKAFLELIKKYPEMDGLFVANDQMALSVLQTAVEMGISVPGNLKVVGFDGIPESEFYSPSLTTIYQNLEDLGSTVVKALVQLIEKRNMPDDEPDPKYIQIQPKLIIRQSTQID
jgi:LacI family transcriptional regulator